MWEGRRKEKDVLRTYLMEIDGALNTTQEKFYLYYRKGKEYFPARGIYLLFFSQARGICLEVIVDEYNSL